MEEKHSLNFLKFIFDCNIHFSCLNICTTAHQKNEPCTLKNFRTEGIKVFCQNRSKACLNWLKHSKILQRCHRSKTEHVVGILWKKLFKLLENNEKCLKSSENGQTFSKYSFSCLCCILTNLSSWSVRSISKIPQNYF